MLRRKAGKDLAETDTNSQVSIPLGGATVGTVGTSSGIYSSGDGGTATQARHRRKRKSHGWMKSCWVRLSGIIPGSTSSRSSRRKIESGLAANHLQMHTNSRAKDKCTGWIAIVFLLVVLLGAFHYYTGTLEIAKHKYLVLPSNTNLPESLISEVLESELRLSIEDHEALSLLILMHADSTTTIRRGIHYPRELGHKQQREMQYVDFGNIHLRLLPNDEQKRQIYRLIQDLQGDPRSLNEARDDDYDGYYAFDDDIEKNPYSDYDDYTPSMEGRCRRVAWHRYNLPNCNAMHELDLVTNTPRFVGDGAYREVFVTEQPYMAAQEQMIFKEIRWDLDHGVDSFEYVRMDAFVTERLTSNQHIVDIFGFCGLSMLTEYFPFGDIEKDVVGFQDHDKNFNPLNDKVLKPLNNYTAAEKLQLALNMAEPVAALHNFKDGVIVHDDIQLCQYLWTEEEGIGVKLNDFNRAEIMLWDEQAQQYCKYKNGRGHGDWRAPEEFKDLPLDEFIDVWSLGNNFYSLLTGVYPYFNVEKDKDIQQMVKDGEKPLIDPRYVDSSFAERKLVDVILRCFEYDPELRADINEIRRMLKEAIVENEQREKEKAKRIAEAKRKEREAASKQVEANRARQAEEEAQDQSEAERLRIEEEAQEKAESERIEQEALRRADEQIRQQEAEKRSPAQRDEPQE
ncbi:Probable serine/threonine-protein kinase [Seminavis robusta]|uniref:Probable serine/threonine-protein kinase n=1 Tax=Seminavis robusta TaxID=568900 RepID=A0A9N8EFF7_9STRA|nr:Probable serine/threonine-protein kinase [Seminavis robusta]|eukprot:Sro921_g220350.1 Probable serine/threonine-protein kinase (682) ;mRNA; f:11653-14396